MKKQLENIKKVVVLIAVMLCCTTSQAAAQAVTPSDYLILQSIGDYHSSGKGKCGNGAGLLGAAAHFSKEHSDTTCRTGYYFTARDLAVSVQVTLHTDPVDSRKWLLHEIDKSFRTSLGIPGEQYAMRVIDGNTIMVFGSAGWTYRWLSGNKVVQIQYHDSQMTKTEPLEVVHAYLAKHPSTLAIMTSADLRTKENKTTWIKDEMDRRLWLCDKWFYQLQPKKAEEKDVYRETVKSMNVFLDYREKYYGIKAVDEKNLLAGYLAQNNGTGIKAKLTEYKNWWSVNKDKNISL